MTAHERRPPVIAEGLFSYQIGGSERVGADLAKQFRARGYRVVCFAFYDSEGPIRQELESAGIECLDLNYEKFGRVTRRVVYQLRIWQLLKRERVAALHVHHATALILCGIAARLAKVPNVTMTEHGLHQLIERPNYRRSATRYCRLADVITAVESTQTDYFAEHMAVPRSKLHVVPNGVRIVTRTAAEKQAIRATLGLDPNTFVFFYVGRLNAVKDLGTMLRAMSALRPNVTRRVSLCLVGDGPERVALEQLRTELGLDDCVTFLGARTDVSQILGAADAFVMSSRTEGLPMALLEAMSAGLACTATAVGGIPQLLADGRGQVVPPKDPPALANAMANLVNDPAARAAIEAKALAHVREHYSLEAVTDKYLDLLGLPRSWPQPNN